MGRGLGGDLSLNYYNLLVKDYIVYTALVESDQSTDADSDKTFVLRLPRVVEMSFSRIRFDNKK